MGTWGASILVWWSFLVESTMPICSDGNICTWTYISHTYFQAIYVRKYSIDRASKWMTDNIWITGWWFQTFLIFTPTWGRNLTNIFQMGWNHQLVGQCVFGSLDFVQASNHKRQIERLGQTKVSTAINSLPCLWLTEDKTLLSLFLLKITQIFSTYTTTWNAKCPIFQATWPLKPATIPLKIVHLAFQVGGFVLHKKIFCAKVITPTPATWTGQNGPKKLTNKRIFLRWI